MLILSCRGFISLHDMIGDNVLISHYVKKILSWFLEFALLGTKCELKRKTTVFIYRCYVCFIKKYLISFSNILFDSTCASLSDIFNRTFIEYIYFLISAQSLLVSFFFICILVKLLETSKK